MCSYSKLNESKVWQCLGASWDAFNSRYVPYFPIRSQFLAVQAWKEKFPALKNIGHPPDFHKKSGGEPVYFWSYPTTRIHNSSSCVLSMRHKETGDISETKCWCQSDQIFNAGSNFWERKIRFLTGVCGGLIWWSTISGCGMGVLWGMLGGKIDQLPCNIWIFWKPRPRPFQVVSKFLQCF